MSKNEDFNFDIIKMDVPLFIRILEYAREDAKEDVDLHNVAQKAIELSKKDVLRMKNYEKLVGSNTANDDADEKEEPIVPNDDADEKEEPIEPIEPNTDVDDMPTDDNTDVDDMPTDDNTDVDDIPTDDNTDVDDDSETKIFPHGFFSKYAKDDNLNEQVNKMKKIINL